MWKCVIQRLNMFKYNAKTCYLIQKSIILRRKHVIQSENVLINSTMCYAMLKRAIERKTCYPTQKRVMQRENVLSNATNVLSNDKRVIPR